MCLVVTYDALSSIFTADLRDDEATQQVESTQLAAAEIERLVEDKQRLAEHLQEEVKSHPSSTDRQDTVTAKAYS